MTLPRRRPWPRTGKSVYRTKDQSWWIYRLGLRKWEAREFNLVPLPTAVQLSAIQEFKSLTSARQWCYERAWGAQRKGFRVETKAVRQESHVPQQE